MWLEVNQFRLIDSSVANIQPTLPPSIQSDMMGRTDWDVGCLGRMSSSDTVPGTLPSTGPATLQSVCTAADFRAVHTIDSGREMLTVSLLMALRHRQRSGPHRLDSKALPYAQAESRRLLALTPSRFLSILRHLMIYWDIYIYMLFQLLNKV